MKLKTTKRGAPPRYDAAFKEGAVKLVTEQGRRTSDVANELGVSADSLRTWLKAAGVVPAQADRSNKDAKRIRELETQLRDAKRREAEKDAVIDVLKKSPGRSLRSLLGSAADVGILSNSLECKYRFVQTDTSGLSKDKLWQILEISRSAYYAWTTRKLEVFYNRVRPHSGIVWLSPCAFVDR